MRKVALFFVLALSLSACSISDITKYLPNTPTPPPPPTETVYMTPSDTPTITPTSPTPTFTATPTFFASGGSTSTPAFGLLPTSTLWVLSEKANPLTPASYGFSGFIMSGNQLFYGKCQPNSIKVTAKPTDIIRTHYVLLFLKLQDKNSSYFTNWGSGAIMDSDGKGTFTYTLAAKNLPGYQAIVAGWIQYQFVATDKKLNVIGRTMVVRNGISYAACP